MSPRNTVIFISPPFSNCHALVAVLFWEGFMHLHSRLNSFWWLLLINQCWWSCSVFEAVEMSPCSCCLCLRVCVAAFLFLLCWLPGGWSRRGVTSSIYRGWTTSKWVSLVCCYKLFVPEFCWSPLFFPTPLRPSREVVYSDITGGKQ